MGRNETTLASHGFKSAFLKRSSVECPVYPLATSAMQTSCMKLHQSMRTAGFARTVERSTGLEYSCVGQHDAVFARSAE
jgi:hypothetical protein